MSVAEKADLWVSHKTVFSDIVAEGVVQGMHAAARAPICAGSCAEGHEPLLLGCAASRKEEHSLLSLKDCAVWMSQLQRRLPQPA